MLKFILKCVLVVLILAFFAFLTLNQETKDADDQALRETEPHQSFLTNDNGMTHFQATGDDNETVIMIHGVSGPMIVWDKLFSFLASRSMNVVRYDLFGRGLSSRLPGEYDLERYDHQLHELIVKNKLKGPITLIGSSMGCIVAANFRNKHPELVHKLILIGPAGFAIQASSAAKLLNVPYLGEYLMGVIGTSMLQEHHRKYFVHAEKFPEVLEAYRQQLLVRGTKLAILSTMRRMPVNDFLDGYGLVGKSKTPVLLIWGEMDATFPFENHKKMLELIPQAKFVRVKEAAHLPQYEQFEIVNAEVGSFLKSRN